MFYVLVEIRSYRQLSRIRPRVLGELDRTLDALFSAYAPTSTRREDGLRLYSFPGDVSHGRLPAVDAAQSAIRLLLDRAEDLSGYLILIHAEDEGAADELLRRMRRLSLTATEDGLYVTGACAPTVEPRLSLRKEGDLYLVGSGAPADRRETVGVHRLATRPAALDSVWQLLEPIVNGVEPPVPLLFYGGQFSATEQTLAAVVAELAPSSGVFSIRPGGVAAPVLDPDIAGRPYAPALGAVARALSLRTEPTRLTRSAATLWRSLVPALLRPRNMVPDEVERDAATLLRVSLEDYAARARSELREPIVVVERADLLDSQSLSLLGDAVKAQSGVQWVFTGREAALPAPLETGETRRSRMPALTTAELEDLLPIGDSLGLRRMAEGAVVLAILHLRRGAAAERSDARTEGAAELFLDCLGADARRTALLHICASGLLDYPTLRGVVGALGLSSVSYVAAIRELADLGFLRSEREPDCVLDETAVRLLSLCLERNASELAEVRSAVRTGLAADPPHCRGVAHLAVSAPGEAFLDYFEAYSRRVVDSPGVGDAAECLAEGAPRSEAAGRGGEDIYRRLVGSRRLQLAMARGDVAAATLADAERAQVRVGGGRKRYYALSLLARSELALFRKDTKLSGELAKQATLQLQEEEDPRGLQRAHLLYCHTLLARELLGEARDYLAVVGKEAEMEPALGPPYRMTRLELVAGYLYGSLGRVQAASEDAGARSSADGQRGWELYFRFIAARMLFDLGLYDEAGDGFGGVAMQAEGYGRLDVRRTAINWMGRSLGYGGHPDWGRRVLATSEASAEGTLFLLENALLAEDWSRALDIARAAGEFPVPEAFPIRHVDWTTGFASLEDLAVGVTDGLQVAGRLSASLSAYARVMAGEEDETRAGLETLRSLTRGGRASPIDPNLWLYMYLYSRALGRASVATDNRLAMLGRAVRHSQERGSRIESYTHKVAFQRSNYWNSRLLEEGRANNLI